MECPGCGREVKPASNGWPRHHVKAPRQPCLRSDWPQGARERLMMETGVVPGGRLPDGSLLAVTTAGGEPGARLPHPR